jgi:protoheme IX farnesyltransferase
MRFRRLSVVTSVLTYLTILIGGFTRGSGAGYGCRDAWPLCEHPVTGQLQLFPDWSHPMMVIEWTHRAVALLAGIFILWVMVRAWRRHRDDKRVLASATLAGVLLPIQAMLGAATVWYFTGPHHGWLATLHMGTASALFASVIAVTIFAYQPPRGRTRHLAGDEEPAAPAGPEEPASVADYAAMTKPRIVALLVAMGGTGMVLAPGEFTIAEGFWTLVGGALGAGCGGVINQVLERDLDRSMERTSDRAVASGRVRPRDALAFAAGLGASSFTMLAFMVNVLAAVLTMLGVLFYVFIYTLWLKPSTPQGVVVGGAAGMAPALVGWAAVTGGLGLPALLLGAVVFLWTPPHFWALAIARREDYASAGFPMMPNAWGLEATKRRMVLYTLATILAAVAFYPMGVLSTFYLVASTILGLAFLAGVLAVVVDHDPDRARGLFFGSIAYLALLFGAMVVDRTLWLAV